jgi:general secretion pathway protein A
MYADFFGLRELPFNNTPDPRFFYSTPDHEEALASLIYAVEERKGFVLLTGEVGAGKTLVSRMMLRRFGSRIAFANITHAVQDATDLLESVCAEFELNIPQKASNAQFVRILQDYLLGQFAQNIPVVLILDEAQNLSGDVFEQLRMIGNLEADDAKLLQVVVVGQPELQRMFASRELRQLRQRIFRTFHLPALSREATAAYIRHRLSIAAAPDLEIFDESAIDSIFKVSQGLPRVINTVCDNAMLSAYSADRRLIDGPFIDSVAGQMMMLDGSTTTEPRVTEEVAEQPQPCPAIPDPAQPVTPPAPVVIHDNSLLERELDALVQRVTGLEDLVQRVAGLEDLVQRVAGLEDLVQQKLTDRGNHAHALEQELRDKATAFLNREIDRFERQIRAKADEAGQGIVAMEHRLKGAAALWAQARAVHAELEPLVERARNVIGRSETASRILDERETQIEELTTNVRAVVDEVQQAHHGLERTAAEADQAERNARAVLDRLTAQTRQSQQLADTTTRIVDRIVQKHVPDAANAGIIKEASATVAHSCGPHRRDTIDPAADGQPPGTNGGRLLTMLTSTRDTLSDLRTWVRKPRGLSVTESPPKTRESTPSTPPARSVTV